MIMPDARAIGKAAEIITRGGLVAMPTETVYGLAADAASDAAVARVFEAKGRPRFNPLIVHVADLAMARTLADFPPLAEKLAAAFWPGPLTLVLARKSRSPLTPAKGGVHETGNMDPGFRRDERGEVSLLVSAGLDTIALRAPDHPAAQGLIRAAGRPLAAPSANRSGTVSPTRPEHVRESLGDMVDFILDAGPCPVGVESTIVKIEDEKAFLLRPGGLAREEIERVTGAPLATPAQSDRVEAPGNLESHYAPQARLRIDADAPRPDEAFLAFGPSAPDSPYALNLSPAGDLREAAANLFAYLRRLDALCAKHGLSGVAAAPIPVKGLGEAINDRLARAAHP
ncbi:MAG: L-threonylcarbamoyladenylate synthase [Parvularculaceae bacterium]